ncbi:tol-pal system protein YbgF [Paenirhodobacter enshiensis]|uniref:tol-pal system protein YbgF n=1 Tax=Paenirhodobacter enshiensis TaxID=1105367 RepID=UPI0035B18550
MRGLLLGAALTLALAAPAFAQDKQTLADIRSELDQLSAQLQGLRGELVSSGAKGMQAAGGATALQRMDNMEAELSRLTSKTEAMQNQINRVLKDANNRIGDLEFRVCDLEKGCDPASVSSNPLGGATGGGASGGGSTGAAASPLTAPSAPSAAIAKASGGSAPAAAGASDSGAQADFDRAKGVLGQGDFRGAADQFQTFAQTYPASPLTADALYMRGDALNSAGDTKGAARAWLDAFSASPNGKRAPDNLFRLGQALGSLGQKSEACTTLNEVISRFPQSSAASKVPMARSSLGCR